MKYAAGNEMFKSNFPGSGDIVSHQRGKVNRVLVDILIL